MPSPSPSGSSPSSNAGGGAGAGALGASATNPNLYPEDAWITMSVVLIVIGLFQWGSVLHSKVVKQPRHRHHVDAESVYTSPYQRTGWSLARLPLAAANVFRVVAFRWTIEVGTYDLTVADIVLTLAYIAFLLFWTFINEQLGVTAQKVSNWSGQAALTAASQFPLVTALGTKNNIVSLITGIGHEKLNFFHRVTARSCFGLLVIHAGGEIYSLVGTQTFYSSITQSWLRLGITALTSFTILLIISLRPIRSKAYELFFYTHFILVFIFLMAAYYHTSEPGFSYWIWPSFIFWALDRFLRIVRVVACNHLYFGFSRRARLQDATTELISDNLVRVRVRRPLHVQWWPGQTAYLIMPSVSRFPLEAHPFSISSIDSALFRPDTRDSAQTGEAEAIEESAQWKELAFLIHVRGGLTRRLKDFAKQHQTVKVFIDGPYGYSPDMAAYDTSILVAGGSGVTYTLPVFLNIIDAARKNPIRCRRVVFIWAIRDANLIQWISNTLYRVNALTPTWLTVSIRIFITRGGSPFSGSRMDQSSDKERLDERIVPPSARVETGRPDLKSILRDEVEMASGRMCITVCGPQSLTRSVRRASRFPVSGPSSVLSGGPSVTLHVESFGYA